MTNMHTYLHHSLGCNYVLHIKQVQKSKPYFRLQLEHNKHLYQIRIVLSLYRKCTKCSGGTGVTRYSKKYDSHYL